MDLNEILSERYRTMKRASKKTGVECLSKCQFISWATNNSKISKILVKFALTNKQSDNLCIGRLSLEKGFLLSNLKVFTRGEHAVFRINRKKSNSKKLGAYESRRLVTKERILYKYFYDNLRTTNIKKNIFLKIMIKNKVFLNLYKKYKNSGYIRALKPRLILKNTNKPTTLGNITFTSGINRSKVRV